MSYLKIKTLSLAFVVSMAMSMSVGATTIIYAVGHNVDVTAAALGDVFLAAGNPAGGFPMSSLDDAIGDGFTGIYGAYDALVLGEDASLSAASITAIQNFTNAGGHTVVLGAHGSEVGRLNALFGYTVTGFAAPQADHATITKVAGTTGPDTLLALNGSFFITGSPGTVLYTRDAGGEAAFIDTVGSGTVSWLAWDFCECSELDSDQADWFSVLGTTAIAAPPAGGPTVPVPTLSIYGILMLVLSVFFGALYINRRRWV